MFVAIGTDVVVGSSRWPALGGSVLGSWETAAECRALFADFECLAAPKQYRQWKVI